MNLGYGKSLDGLSVKPNITSEEDCDFYLYFIRHCSQDKRYVALFFESNSQAESMDNETRLRCFADYITREFWNKRIELLPTE